MFHDMSLPTCMYLSRGLRGLWRHSTAPPSVFCLPDGAPCQGRPSAAQTRPAWTHVAPDRQPLLATVTKDSVGFVFNEALLCIHSIITAIWLSSLNMPPHFARKFGSVSKGGQLVWWCAVHWDGWGLLSYVCSLVSDMTVWKFRAGNWHY